MPPNNWNLFLKTESTQQNGDPFKLKIKQYSHTWKNKLANIVTIDILHIKYLHDKIQTLQQKCISLEIENRYLSNIITLQDLYNN